MFRVQKIAESANIPVIYALSGEVVVGTKNEVIISSPLGSCVAVVVYNTQNKTGGIAHIMLPGKSPQRNILSKNKYTIDAVEELLSLMNNANIDSNVVDVCLVGGANVLRKEDDTISEAVVKSVQEVIKKKNLNILASSLGGFERRSASVNLRTGIISFTIGNGEEEVLWNFND